MSSTKTVATYEMSPVERALLEIDFAAEILAGQSISAASATLVEVPSLVDRSTLLALPPIVNGSAVSAWVGPGLVRGHVYELSLVVTLAGVTTGPTYDRRITIPCV